MNFAIEPIVLVHGGAGDIPDSRDNGKLIGCKLAVRRGYTKLQASGSVLDAVEEAVRSMELDDNFNAGDGLNCIFEYEQFHLSHLYCVYLRLWISTQSRW